MTYMATSLHKNHRSGGHEIYNFGRTFLGHHYCTCQLNLFDLCLGVEKKILMHFHVMTYISTSLHKNHCPGGHKIYNFGRTFLGHHYCTCQLNLYDLCLGVEKKILNAFSLYDLHGHVTAQEPLPRGS